MTQQINTQNQNGVKVDMFYIVAKFEGLLLNRSKVMAGFRFSAN